MNEETVDRMDLMLTHHGEGGAAGLAPATARPISADVFEEEYQRIGCWTGPDATPEAWESRREFWRSSGKDGVLWLVRRLRQERHIDVLDGAASLLAELGEIILVPAFEELGRSRSRDLALCLIWALVSLSESAPGLRIGAGPPEPILAARLQDDDPDIREAAAEAMRLLGPERAARWLEQRLRDETNEEVRQTIERELTRHRVGRT